MKYFVSSKQIYNKAVFIFQKVVGVVRYFVCQLHLSFYILYFNKYVSVIVFTAVDELVCLFCSVDKVYIHEQSMFLIMLASSIHLSVELLRCSDWFFTLCLLLEYNIECLAKHGRASTIMSCLLSHNESKPYQNCVY